MLVQMYDYTENCIVSRLLDMCTATSATAHSIYTALDNRLIELIQGDNPWSLCTSISVDNASVNLGVRDSLKTRILQRNSAIYFNGCPCHIIHNASRKAWNGSSFFPRSSPQIHVYSDASGSYGCGAFQVGGKWCQLQWPQSWHAWEEHRSPGIGPNRPGSCSLGTAVA